MKLGRRFNYGQWTVTLKRRECGYFEGEKLSDCVDIQVMGNWHCAYGILYDTTRDCCNYDYPEWIPQGLKELIYKKAMRLLQC